jgi:hypothetical protein
MALLVTSNIFEIIAASTFGCDSDSQPATYETLVGMNSYCRLCIHSLVIEFIGV